MAESHSTATPEAAKATSTAHTPVQDINVAEMESDRTEVMSDRMVRAVGGGSPQTPPSMFAGALGQLGGSSQAGMLRGLQRGYGNSYVGRVIQRKCEKCEKAEIQRQGEGDVSTIPEGFESAMQRSTGNPLDEETRSFMESRFGEDFSDVQVHTDTAAADAAKLVQAQAFTAKRDIYFGVGKYQPNTSKGRHLLAHELTHTLQQRSSEPSSFTSTYSSFQPYQVANESNNALEEEANTVASSVASGHPVSLTSISQITQPQIQFLGEGIESDNPAERAEALQQIISGEDESAWRAILLAQESSHTDVSTTAEATIINWLANRPEFEMFVLDLADRPGGVLSDLAIRALALSGREGVVSIDNYRTVIRQRFDIARDYLQELDDQLYEIIHAVVPNISRSEPVAVPEIEQMQTLVNVMPLENLWEIGLRASTLLERLGVIREAIYELQTLSRQFSEGGAIRQLIQSRLLLLLIEARALATEEADVAFGRILETLADWPGDFASALVNELHKQFTEARNTLTSAMERRPLPSFRNAWNDFSEQVIVPLKDDLEVLIAEIEALQPEAQQHPDAVFGQLQFLEYHIQSIGERALYTLQATNMMDIYTELALTDEAAKDVLLETEQNLKLLFANFAQLAADRDRNPEATRQIYETIVSSEEFEDVHRDVQAWNEILAGELAFAQFLGDVMIVIASIYTAGGVGGFFGGLVRGFLGRGAAIGLAGRAAIGVATFAGEVTAFHLTSRGLRWAIYGEEFFGEDFLEEYGKTAILFAILRGSGAIYQRFIAPRLPLAVRGAGAFTTSFSVFQAWAVTMTALDTDEWIGPTDERFWKLAVHNALFLGALHLGLGISRNLEIPMSFPENIQSRLDQHRHNCSQLTEMIDAWRRESRPSETRAREILQRARTLFLERLEVMRSLYENNFITPQEFASSETFIQEYVAATEAAEFQMRVRFRPHETDSSTFYYEGEPSEILEFYRPRGFEVVSFNPATGRVLIWDPAGQMLNLIRLGARDSAEQPLLAPVAETTPSLEPGLETLREVAELSPEAAQALQVRLMSLDPVSRAELLGILGQLRTRPMLLEPGEVDILEAIAVRPNLRSLPGEQVEIITRDLEGLDLAEREVRLDEIEEMALSPETVDIPLIEATTDLGTYVINHPNEGFRGFRQALIDYADEFAGQSAPLEAQLNWMRQYFANGSPRAVNLRINRFKGMLREISDRILAEETGYTNIIPDRITFSTPLGERRMDLSGTSPFGTTEYLETKYSDIDISQADLIALENAQTVWDLLNYIDTNYTSLGRRPNHIFREIVKDIYLIETENLLITWKVNSGPSDLRAILGRWRIHYITYQ